MLFKIFEPAIFHRPYNYKLEICWFRILYTVGETNGQHFFANLIFQTYDS